MKLFVATSNAGKLRDFAAAAALFGVTIEPLPGLKEIPAPAEDAETFEGNARIKAEFYSRHAAGELVLADDSGLEVDALHGEPGVRSARWADDAGFAGTGSTDERNNALLLQRLGDIAERAARYRCVLAVARDGEVLQMAEGSVEGSILKAPLGEGGFGYDPLFWLSEEEKSMAQMPMDTRQRVSHRGRALVRLLEDMQRA